MSLRGPWLPAGLALPCPGPGGQHVAPALVLSRPPFKLHCAQPNVKPAAISLGPLWGVWEDSSGLPAPQAATVPSWPWRTAWSRLWSPGSHPCSGGGAWQCRLLSTSRLARRWGRQVLPRPCPQQTSRAGTTSLLPPEHRPSCVVLADSEHHVALGTQHKHPQPSPTEKPTCGITLGSQIWVGPTLGTVAGFYGLESCLWALEYVQPPGLQGVWWPQGPQPGNSEVRLSGPSAWETQRWVSGCMPDT